MIARTHTHTPVIATPDHDNQRADARFQGGQSEDARVRVCVCPNMCVRVFVCVCAPMDVCLRQ